jgi:hypothetical protein
MLWPGTGRQRSCPALRLSFSLLLLCFHRVRLFLFVPLFGLRAVPLRIHDVYLTSSQSWGFSQHAIGLHLPFYSVLMSFAVFFFSSSLLHSPIPCSKGDTAGAREVCSRVDHLRRHAVE